jgi:hypothetical protein
MTIQVLSDYGTATNYDGLLAEGRPIVIGAHASSRIIIRAVNPARPWRVRAIIWEEIDGFARTILASEAYASNTMRKIQGRRPSFPPLPWNSAMTNVVYFGHRTETIIGDEPDWPNVTLRVNMAVRSNILQATVSRVYGTNVVTAGQDHKKLSSPAAGKYNIQIIEAVQNRWCDLLERRDYAGQPKGSALLTFHLDADGSVSNVCIITNTVNLALAKLAESAIEDVAPFPKWPDEMRSEAGGDVLKVSLDFHYDDTP